MNSIMQSPKRHKTINNLQVHFRNVNDILKTQYRTRLGPMACTEYAVVRCRFLIFHHFDVIRCNDTTPLLSHFASHTVLINQFPGSRTCLWNSILSMQRVVNRYGDCTYILRTARLLNETLVILLYLTAMYRVRLLVINQIINVGQRSYWRRLFSYLV